MSDRRDALADAETLRLFYRDGRHFLNLGRVPSSYLAWLDLGGGTRSAIRVGHQNVAARRAVAAARAAFQAVPGLRADDVDRTPQVRDNEPRED